MLLQEIISALSAESGPSGLESSVSRRISEYIAPYADAVETDAMGNLIALRSCGVAEAPKLMLCAHMDEIGLVVTGIEEGFLCFDALGGMDARMLPAREVKVLTTPPMLGVVATMPPHVLSAGEMDTVTPLDKLRIDVGLSQAEAEARIPLGTPVVFAGGCTPMGEHLLCGKALDDRSCAAVLVKVLELLQGKKLDVDLYLLFSTQEELGMRGAGPGTFSIAPDWAVAVDVTFARTPEIEKRKAMVLGGGAAIGRGPNMNKKLTALIERLADDAGIPWQTEVMAGSSGTDGWVIQTSRSGVATAVVSLPLRYMHSPVELIDVRDAQAVAELLTSLAQNLGKGEADA